MSLLCQMDQEERLSLLSEGFPILLASAQSYRSGARTLKENWRAATVLYGLATEEAAKILILMDIVRCPETLLKDRQAKICKWFYNHHARLVYANACSVTKCNIDELQSGFINWMRQSHRIDGPGAPIVPQWELWEREAFLYADVACADDGKCYWHAPPNLPSPDTFVPALNVAEAMHALGFFTLTGVTVTSDVWSESYFLKDTAGVCEYPRFDVLVDSNIRLLREEGLITEYTKQVHPWTVRRLWQLPMYDLDLSPIPVDLETLEGEMNVNDCLLVGYR